MDEDGMTNHARWTMSVVLALTGCLFFIHRALAEEPPKGGEDCRDLAQREFQYYLAGDVIEWLRVLRMLRRGDTVAAIAYIEEEPLGHKLSNLVVTRDSAGNLMLRTALTHARMYRADYGWKHQDTSVEEQIAAVLRKLDDARLWRQPPAATDALP